MKNFKWAEPRSMEQLMAFLGRKVENVFLMAGGTDLLAEIKEEILAPDVVVDLRSIPGLSGIKKEKDGLRIGALTTVAEIASDPVIRKDYPVLHQAARSVGSPQLRNMGTLGGNLCQRPRCWYYRDPQLLCRKKGGSKCYASRGRNKYHAILGGSICHIVHPSDLAPALVALDSEIRIISPRGEKAVPISEFFTLPSVNVKTENVLQADEAVKEVKIPPAKKNDKGAYFKFTERGGWDFAVVSAAVQGSVSGKSFREIKIVAGGVAPIPWRLKNAEIALRDKPLTEEAARLAFRKALEAARPLEENGFKKELAEVVLTRAVLSLISSL